MTYDPSKATTDLSAGYEQHYDVRQPGQAPTMGAALRGDYTDMTPYEPPLWAQPLPMMGAQEFQSFDPSVGRPQQPPQGDAGFPIRWEMPNPFYQPAQQAQLIEGIPEEFAVMAGLQPGTQRGGTIDVGGFEVATAPVSIANLESWTREGFASLLSYYMLGGAYQRDMADQFTEDTEYTGTEELGFTQSLLQGYIESRKAMGDALWSMEEMFLREWRSQDARFRIEQTKSLIHTGAAPAFIGAQGIVSAFTTVLSDPGAAFGGTNRWSIEGVIQHANNRGIDPMTAIAELYDLPIEVVLAVSMDPNISEATINELAKGDGQGLAFSTDPATDAIVNAGAFIGMVGVQMIAGGGIAKAGSGLARGLAPGMSSAFGAGLRGSAIRGAGGVVPGAARAAGRATRLGAKAVAAETAAGWSIRGFEWGVKQAAVTLNNQELVALMDNLMYENPWAYNPGLNLMDAFSFQPIRALKPLFKSGDRKFHLGTESSPGHIGTINLTDRTFTTPRTDKGALDIDYIFNTKEARSDIEVVIYGNRVKLPKNHPQAKLVETVRTMEVDDMLDTVLKGTGWDRKMVIDTFGPNNPYDLTYEHLRGFVVYGYGQAVRNMEGSSVPLMYSGGTLREVSNSYFREHAPEVLALLESDMRGQTSELSTAIKTQWWDLGDVKDSKLAELKSRKQTEYIPAIAFENMKHWIIASDTLNKALAKGADVGDYVPGYSRSVNRQYLQDFRARIVRQYPDSKMRIPAEEVERFRSRTGLVERFAPELKEGKSYTQEQFLRLIDDIEKAGVDPKDKRVIFADGSDEAMLSNASDLPTSELVWADDAVHYHARALGLQTEDVILIETVMTKGSNVAPSGPLMARVSEQSLLTPAALKAMKPEDAWEAITSWYSTRLAAIRKANVDVRVPLLDFTKRVDQLLAEGLINEAIGYRAVRAAQRLAAEAVNPPKRAGVDPSGAEARYTQANLVAARTAKGIQSHLLEPQQRGRVIHTTAEGVPDYVSIPETTGLVKSLAALAEWVRQNPGTVIIRGDAERALVNDPNVHPLLKAEALLDVPGWQSAPDDIQRIAQGLSPQLDGRGIAKQIVDELVPLADDATEPPLADRLATAATDVQAHHLRSQELAGELLDAEAYFDTIRGQDSDELVRLIDRVSYSDVDVNPMTPLDNAVVAARSPEGHALQRERTQLARLRSQLQDVEGELAAAELAVGAQAGETGSYAFSPVMRSDGSGRTVKVKGSAEKARDELGPVARQMHEETGLAYAIVDVRDAQGRLKYRELREGVRRIDEATEEPETPAQPRPEEPEAAPAEPAPEPVAAEPTELDQPGGTAAMRRDAEMMEAEEARQAAAKPEHPEMEVLENVGAPEGSRFGFYENGVWNGHGAKDDAIAVLRARKDGVSYADTLKPEVLEKYRLPRMGGGAADLAPEVMEAIDGVETYLGVNISRTGAVKQLGTVKKWADKMGKSVEKAIASYMKGNKLIKKDGMPRQNIGIGHREALANYERYTTFARELSHLAENDVAVYQVLGRMTEKQYQQLVEYMVDQMPEVKHLPDDVFEQLRRAGQEVQVDEGVGLATRAQELFNEGLSEGAIANRLKLTYDGTEYPIAKVRRILGLPEPQHPGVDEAVLAASKGWGIEPRFGKSAGLDPDVETALVGEWVRDYPEVPKGWEVDPDSPLLVRRPMTEAELAKKSEYEEPFQYAERSKASEFGPDDGSTWNGYRDQALDSAERSVLMRARANAEMRAGVAERNAKPVVEAAPATAKSVEGGKTSFPDPFDENQSIDATFRLMDVDDLITSDKPSYRQELQGRGRGERADLEAQVEGMAEDFNPALATRVESGVDGSPLVGSTDEVLVGNGRTMAMRRMDDAGWARYKAYLMEHAEEYGLTTQQIVDMGDHPVLVRVIGDEYMDVKYSNAFNPKGKSPAEMAISVARLIQPEDVLSLQLGETVVLREALKQPSKADFVRRVISDLTPEEQRTLTDAKGNVSDAGTQLIENALLAKALNDDVALVTRLIETPEEGARFRKGLEMALGQLVKGEANVDDKIGGLLADAYRAILDGIAGGKKLRDIAAEFQTEGMFSDTTLARSPEVDALGRVLTSLKSQTEVASLLRKYGDVTGEPTVGMFDTAPPGLFERINLAINDVEAARNLGPMDEGIPRMPAEDGRVHTTTETPTGTAGHVEAKAADPIVEETIVTAERVFIDDLDEPLGKDTFFRAESDTHAEVLREAQTVPDRDGAVASLTHEFTQVADDPIAFDGWFKQMVAAINGDGPSRHNRGVTYLFVKALTGSDRWGVDGRYDPSLAPRSTFDEAAFKGNVKKYNDVITAADEAQRQGEVGFFQVPHPVTGEPFSAMSPGHVAKALRNELAQLRRDAQVARAGAKLRAPEANISDQIAKLQTIGDQIEVKGQGTGARPDDVVVTGTKAKELQDDFAEVTKMPEPEEPPAVKNIEEATEGAAPTVVRNADQGAQRAAQNKAKTGGGKRDTTVILHEADETRRAQALTTKQQLAQQRVNSMRTEVAAREKRISEMPDPGDVADPGTPLPPDIDDLYRRYIHDSLASWDGIPASGPQTLDDVLQAIRSLDYEVPDRPGSVLTAEERIRLREGLIAYADAKLNEAGVGQADELLTAESLRAQGIEVIDLDDPGPGPRAKTPQEEKAMVEEIARRIRSRIRDTGEPTEDYAGVGYDIVKPGARADGEPTLFYTHELSEELARFDQLIPGLGAELSAGKQLTDAARARKAAEVDMLRDAKENGRFGKLVDTAFGPRPQNAIEAQTWGRFTKELAPDMDDEGRRLLGRGLMGYMHKQMEDHKFGNMPFQTFRRVGHVRGELVEKWAKDYLGSKKEYKGLYEQFKAANPDDPEPIWSAFRKADNRTRAYFADQDGGLAKAIDYIYESAPVRRGSKVLSGLTVLYSAGRFFLDARWLALEFVEAPILLMGREGPDAVWATAKNKPISLLFSQGDEATQLMNRYSWWMEAGDPGGYFKWRNRSLLRMVERGQQRGLVQELEHMAWSDPTLAKMISDSGDTPLEYLTKLDRDWKIAASRSKKMTPEQLDDVLADYVKNGTITPEELAKFKEAGRWVDHPELEAAIRQATDPRLRQMYQRLNIVTQQAWDDAAKIVFGQTDRSNFQRLLNSPMLYWPISYQIKATKWLASMMFDRFAGAQTGALPAVTFDMTLRMYGDKLAQDEDFQQFLKQNENILFLATMLMPITPWDIGVSLSPFTRLFLSMLADDPSEAYQRNLLSVGPGYSYFNLFPRMLKELDENDYPLISGAAEKMRYAFPLQYTIPVAGEPGETRSRSDQVKPPENYAPSEPEEPEVPRFGQ